MASAGRTFAETSPPNTSLTQIASESGRYFGTAARLDQIRSENDLCETILRECSYLTPELALKWAMIEPKRGELSLTLMDDLASFAVLNGMKVHGHTMLWHRSIPDWANEFLIEYKDWSLIKKYFGSIIPRYGDAIEQWDIINEPIETGYRMDGLRTNALLKAFGPEYIRRALEEARMFAPRARLMINEFALDYDTPLERDRRYCFLKLIESLKRSGAPLDGIGLQGHLDLGKAPFSEKVFSDFLGEVAAFDLQIVITELDVKEYDYTSPVDMRDLRVAEEAKRYLNVAFAQSAVKGLISWGLSDRHSWLEISKEDFARYPGAWRPGEGPGVNRGLPFDYSMRPKMLYGAIASAFQQQSSGGSQSGPR